MTKDSNSVAVRLGMKRITLALFDICILLCMGVLSYWLVCGSMKDFRWELLISAVGIQIVVFTIGRLYKVRLLSSSLDLVLRVLVPMLPVCMAFLLYCSFMFGASSIHARAAVVYSCLGFLCVMGVRFMYRIGDQNLSKHHMATKPKALIYGAGETGCTIARMALKNKFDYSIVGFIDDDPTFASEIVQGVPVLGNLNDLAAVLTSESVDTFIIAITLISSSKMQKAVETARRLDIKIKVVPNLFETKSKPGDISIRDIDYADLLGRSLITIEREPIANMLEDKVILVTGAGGSIGSEICRQIMDFAPKKLFVLDIDETELHDLCLKLLGYRSEWGDTVMPILCDIRNRDKVERILEEIRPDVVFHAAAIKHVPMSELYPEEAIQTNICGSYNVLRAAKLSGVKKVVVISTDKAVNPTNVMGATKRVVEMIASAMTSEKTEICAVRFGNVIGSRGSMLPLFLDEIKAGVPITVTDRRIIRYFMAIPEAVGLVFRAATIAKGGEVMVLDMGEPVNIYDFAKKLIDIFGDERSSIRVTGLRLGEKLYEELLANKDTTIPTENKKIFKAKVSNSIDIENLDQHIRDLMNDNRATMVKKLHDTVPEWHSPEPSK